MATAGGEGPAVAPRQWRPQLKAPALRQARELVQRLGPALKARELGDTQWRSLTAAAQEAAVPEEVEALIRYKMGKAADRQGWRASVPANGPEQTVGELCLQAVRAMLGEAERVAEALQVPAERRDPLRLDALALLFGYVAWEVVARRPEAERDRAVGGGGR